MKSTMTKIAAGLLLAVATTSASAAPVAWTGEFAMYNPAGGQMDANDGAAGMVAAVTGFIDTAAGTFTLASTDTFFGINWTSSGGTLFGPGTHTVNVNGDGSNSLNGDGNVTFTVGAGQLGGNINLAWDASSGIGASSIIGSSSGTDIFQVWNVITVDGVTTYTSTDIEGAGIPGTGMIDGPFPGFSANFNMTTPVPEASTYGMLLAGLGLVGFMSRRKKLSAP